MDISGAYHTLMDNDIRHVKNSHGEGTNEKYPVTAYDQKQIPDIIKNYDDVLYAENNGKKGIYYVKRHNGVTYYLEAIINDGRTLSNKQMIKVATGTIPNITGLKDAINKKWNIDSVPNDPRIPRMYVQDVGNNYVPNNNIPQPNDVVKNGYMPNNFSGTEVSSMPVKTSGNVPVSTEGGVVTSVTRSIDNIVNGKATKLIITINYI